MTDESSDKTNDKGPWALKKYDKLSSHKSGILHSNNAYGASEANAAAVKTFQSTHKSRCRLKNWANLNFILFQICLHKGLGTTYVVEIW